MKCGRIYSNNIRELNGTTPINGQVFVHDGQKNKWETLAFMGVETIHLGDCTETQNPFDGTFVWAGIIIPQTTTIVNKLKSWCTQTGTGTYKMGIYNSNFIKISETSELSVSTLGLQNGNLTQPTQLNGGELYYLAIGGNINGASFLGSSLRFQSNPPFIAKEDINLSSLPNSFTSGSSTQRRIWIGAYT